jgi:multiple sugar transport system substrate-binding protein
MKKRTVTAMCSALSIALLAGCGGGNKGDATPDGNKGEAKQPKERIQISITTPAAHAESVFNERFGNALRSKFPEYDIRYTTNDTVKFAQLVATNTEVDLVYAAILDFINNPVKLGISYNMRDLFPKYGIDPNRVGMNWVEGLSEAWEGNVYGLPILLETQSLFYNKDLFDQFGVPYLQDDMTWDDVFTINKKMTRTYQDRQYVGISYGVAQHFSLNSLSLPYYNMKDDRTTLTDQAVKWKTLYETIALLPTQAAGYVDKIKALKGQIPTDTSFKKDRDAAMFAGLTLTAIGSPEMEEMNWDMVSYPTYAAAPKTGAQANLLLFGVTNMSKHKDEAMKILAYLYSDEFQTITSRAGNTPAVVNDARIAAFAQDTYFKDRNVKSVFHAPFAALAPRGKYDSTIAAMYRKYINKLAVGEMDMNTMMRTVEEEVNNAVQATKSQ